jgi:tripartite-type tricarboxylate transporter receptor subunit TctC
MPVASSPVRLTLFAATVGFAFASVPAHAEYPERPVTIVVPYTAGSQTDSVARLIAQALQEKLGQPFLVENKAGASGLVAALAVARAAPDGYTLMVTTNTTHAAAPGLFKNVPYDPVKDFIGIFRSVIAVNATSPVRTMGEFVTYAKANPAKLEYGQGNGTTQVVFETMNRRVGIDVVRVPYRSNPAATTDLVAGHIAVAAPDYLNGLPQIKSGRIRPLAVMTKDRSRILPDVPTLDETVMPGFDIEAWVGLFGPAHLPEAIVNILGREVEQILQRPEVKQRFLDSGSEVKWKAPKEFGEFVKAEVVKWTALTREANIQPE